MATPAILQQVMAARSARGLKLVFKIPGSPDLFTCYPKDEVSKRRWFANARKDGWTLVEED